MKPSSLSVLCLSLLLLHAHFSLAKKGGSGRSSSTPKKTIYNRGSTSNTNTNTNTNKNNQPNQRGNPPRSGKPAHHPKGDYPVLGSPYAGRHAGRGTHHGSYGGGYMNQNPNNKILSPGFAGSYGYGGYGARGGSPFSRSVQSMGIYPSDRSKGYGRTAVVAAAAGGAAGGMAVGYGLGRFPRPPYNFHNRQEEQHYNHYMHKTYGTKSTDTNDYSRDYEYTKPDETYDEHMETCMRRTDLLPVEEPKPFKKPGATTKTTAVTSAQDSVINTNTTETNSTAAGNSSTSAPSTPRPLNPPVASPVPQSYDRSAEDDDTVSIVEIGYPALIEQMKARRCVEKYMEYSKRYLKKKIKPDNGVQGLEMGSRGLLAVVTSTILMLLNSNMLTLLH